MRNGPVMSAAHPIGSPHRDLIRLLHFRGARFHLGTPVSAIEDAGTIPIHLWMQHPFPRVVSDDVGENSYPRKKDPAKCRVLNSITAENSKGKPGWLPRFSLRSSANYTRRRGAGCEQALHLLFNHILRSIPDHLVGHFAALEKQESGNSPDPVA